MLRWLGIFVAAVMCASSAQAQAVKSVVTASNGVEVTVYSDEFASRYEYSSPTVKSGDGTVMIAVVKKGGVAPLPTVEGFFVYSGEWRRYYSALYRGGDQAKFVLQDRDVGRCSSSRYSSPSCVLSESFAIEMAPADLKKYAAGGTVAIQVRAQDGTATIFEIPVSYFDAVSEVMKR